MDTATKTVMDAAKTAFKRVAQKTAETTGALIGNKIAEKITSIIALDFSKKIESKNPDLKQKINFFRKMLQRLVILTMYNNGHSKDGC